MLVRHELDGSTERSEVVDVGRVGVDGASKSLGLHARRLVSGVEHLNRT